MLDIGNLSEWHRQDGPVRAHPACTIRTDSRRPASNQRSSAPISVLISLASVAAPEELHLVDQRPDGLVRPEIDPGLAGHLRPLCPCDSAVIIFPSLVAVPPCGV